MFFLFLECSPLKIIRVVSEEENSGATQFLVLSLRERRAAAAAGGGWWEHDTTTTTTFTDKCGSVIIVNSNFQATSPWDVAAA